MWLVGKFFKGTNLIGPGLDYTEWSEITAQPANCTPYFVQTVIVEILDIFVLCTPYILILITILVTILILKLFKCSNCCNNIKYKFCCCSDTIKYVY